MPSLMSRAFLAARFANLFARHRWLAIGLAGSALLLACGGAIPPDAAVDNEEPQRDDTSEALNAAAGNSLAAGFDHTCVILEGGAVKCWGDNEFGKLGIGSTATVGAGAFEMGNNLPTVSLGKG